MKRLSVCCLFLLLTLGQGTAHAQGKFGEQAADFPPGLFSDGQKYQVSDFQGKVLVLFFYESTCPRCRASIPERNQVVKAFKDKPVKFIAIGASDPWSDVQSYARSTGLAMPIFADSLGIMETRYGQKMSLQNIWQFRVIGPDGKIIGYDMSAPALEKALSEVQVSWKYKGDGYDPKLDATLDAFESSQYTHGMKLLAPLRKSTNKKVAESAAKLHGVLKKEAEAWKAEAEKAADSDPLQAYDLYTRVATLFGDDPLGKSVAEPLRKLAANKAVGAEVAARKAFSKLDADIVQMTPAQKKPVIQFCQNIVKKHPKTPTAEKAQALAAELGK